MSRAAEVSGVSGGAGEGAAPSPSTVSEYPLSRRSSTELWRRGRSGRCAGAVQCRSCCARELWLAVTRSASCARRISSSTAWPAPPVARALADAAMLLPVWRRLASLASSCWDTEVSVARTYSDSVVFGFESRYRRLDAGSVCVHDLGEPLLSSRSSRAVGRRARCGGGQSGAVGGRLSRVQSSARASMVSRGSRCLSGRVLVAGGSATT